MKGRIAILSLFCFNIVSGFSQDTIRIYMDDNFKVVKEDSCSIVRKVIVDENKIYHLWDSFVDGKKIFDGVYSSINPWIEQGLFRYYNDSGSLYATGNYELGFLAGQWIYYDTDKADTVDYAAARKLLKDLYVVEDGFLVLDEFPAHQYNDLNAIQNEYVKNNIHFPPRALEQYGYSKVRVNLHMKKDGRHRPEVLRSDHRDFSYEVQRMLLAAPDTFFANLPKAKNGDYIIDIKFSKYDDTKSHVYDTILPKGDSLLPTFVFVEQQAEFQGGTLNDFREWVMKNIYYPPEAFKNGEFGRATLQFVVGINGRVERVKLLHTSGSKALDDEAMRVVRESPDWVPARQEGKVVCQQFVIPVIFMLQ